MLESDRENEGKRIGYIYMRSSEADRRVDVHMLLLNFVKKKHHFDNLNHILFIVLEKRF